MSNSEAKLRQQILNLSVQLVYARNQAETASIDARNATEVASDLKKEFMQLKQQVPILVKTEAKREINQINKLINDATEIVNIMDKAGCLTQRLNKNG